MNLNQAYASITVSCSHSSPFPSLPPQLSMFGLQCYSCHNASLFDSQHWNRGEGDEVMIAQIFALSCKCQLVSSLSYTSSTSYPGS